MKERLLINNFIMKLIDSTLSKNSELRDVTIKYGKRVSKKGSPLLMKIILKFNDDKSYIKE